MLTFDACLHAEGFSSGFDSYEWVVQIDSLEGSENNDNNLTVLYFAATEITGSKKNNREVFSALFNVTTEKYPIAESGAATSVTMAHSTTALSSSISASRVGEEANVNARKGLSKMAKAGLGVGVSVGVLVLATMTLFLFQHWRRKTTQPGDVVNICQEMEGSMPSMPIKSELKSSLHPRENTVENGPAQPTNLQLAGHQEGVHELA